MPLSAQQQRLLIDSAHPQLSVRRQCELLGLNRSTLYYEPAPETAENLALMKLIDKQYTDLPFYGSQREPLLGTLRGHQAPEQLRLFVRQSHLTSSARCYTPLLLV